MTPTARMDAGNAPVAPWHAGTKNNIRNHLIVMMGEFCGTFMFLFFAFAPTQQAVTAMNAAADPNDTVQIPDVTALLYIASAFGCSLAANVWAFYRINGGMLNPAVTLGLCLAGAVPWIRGLLVFPCQILGGIAAAGVVSALFPGPLLVGVSLGNNTSIVQGLFIEMFITMQLVIVVLLLAAEKHRARALAPLGIGLSLFIAHLAAVYYTGSGVNPARAFGPDVINASFPGYHWIYWLGPFMGAAVAAGFYKMFKLLGYETANPGQDRGDELIGLLYPDEEAALAGGNENVNLLQFHPKRLSTPSHLTSPSSPRGQFLDVEKTNGGTNGQTSRAEQPVVSVQENATADTPPGSSRANTAT